MDSEVKIIISFIFKRSGKQKLSFSELYLDLSINLNWFTPEDAKKFVNEAMEKGFLIKEKDLIGASFDIKRIKIPVGFYPSKRVFIEDESIDESKENTILDKIIKKISEISNENELDTMKKIEQIAEEKNLTAEVAGLLLGKEKNIDLSEFFNQIENNIFT